MSHLHRDSVRGSARSRRGARRCEGFARGTSARPYRLRGKDGCKSAARHVSMRRWPFGLLRIAGRVYRGADLCGEGVGWAGGDLAGRRGLPAPHPQTRGRRRWQKCADTGANAQALGHRAHYVAQHSRATCLRYRHRPQSVEPPNGRISSHLVRDSGRGSARLWRDARRGEWFASGTSAQSYWIRGQGGCKAADRRESMRGGIFTNSAAGPSRG